MTASTVSLTWNSGTDQFQPVRHEILVNGVPTDNAVSNVPAGTIPRPAVQGASVRQLDPSTNYQFSVQGHRPVRQRVAVEQRGRRDDAGQLGHGGADQPDPAQRVRWRQRLVP